MRLRHAALLSTLGFSLIACGGSTPTPTPQAPNGPNVAVAQPPAPAPAAAGYQFTPDALRPYRSYVHVSEVGEYAHHFWVWRLQGSRWVSQKVWVNAEGDTRTVHLGNRHAFSRQNLSVRLTPPSSEAADAARAVRAQFARETAKVEFRGSYRKVVLHEIIPVDIAPYNARTARNKAIMHVDRDFTQIIATPQTSRQRFVDKQGAMAGNSGINNAPPHWVSLPVDNGGRQHLRTGLRVGATAQDGDTRAAILAAARGFSQRQPSPSLTELHAQDSGQLVPPNVQPRLEYAILVGGGRQFAGRHHVGGGKRKQIRTESIRVTFDPRDMARGDAQSTGSATLDGVTYHANVHLKLLTDLSSITAPAQVPVKAQLTVKVRAAQGKPLVKVYEMTGAALVDGPRLAIARLQATKPHRGGFDRGYLPGRGGVGGLQVKTAYSVYATFD